MNRVTVLHEEGDTTVVRYDHGYVCTVGGPFSAGRLFTTEAEAWQYCAEFLRGEAAKIDAVAAECAAKATVVEVAA